MGQLVWLGAFCFDQTSQPDYRFENVMTKLPKTRNENIVVQEMDSEILIYDLNTNKAFCLNETSAVIYHLCDGKRTVAEISRQLSKQLSKSIDEYLI